MTFSLQQEVWMRRALEIARRGFGHTGTNPCVGAIVVRNGRIVGTGYHHVFGGPHAEVLALRSAGRLARGSELYVTLDPCCHFGKTPPCTDAILKAGVGRVLSAHSDPRDDRKKAREQLVKGGVAFESGLLRSEARRVLQPYLKYVKTGLPYVILKVATTLDGKVATSSGISRGITSEISRKRVHLLRSRVDAVLTGGGTVSMDSPHMGVRKVSGRDPLRILLDSDLKLDLDAPFFRDKHVLIFTTSAASRGKVAELRARGIEVVSLSSLADIPDILRVIGEHGISLLMIEAGPKLMTSFIKSRCVDQYLQFIAPKLLGGVKSPTSYEGANVHDLRTVKILKYPDISLIGRDILVDGFLQWY